MISDHGLTPIGSHGGKTEDETYTFVAYFQKDAEFPEEINKKKKNKVIPQTSTCAILSVLGGVNFPFSNIGFWVPELVVFDPEATEFEKTFETLKIFIKNELQIYNYLQKYLAGGDISHEEFENEIKQYLEDIKQRFNDVIILIKDNIDSFKQPKSITPSSDLSLTLSSFVDSYTKTGSKKIDHIKDLLAPEWNTDYITSAIAIGILILCIFLYSSLP
eukprot:CAMPEP_0205800034 /NCGR_PEP_ID=MMETSP0205-20121125/1538_1 /ASSEMBLY_ACC=CAM_ASM_000278 /TAXON_ID=36767 /ORGANISM="Euplotes focardii, Strain TN1" /LENGTH=217 /DNA_ID=CAMNT_0053062409 /DNA_START=578 /DNA_END=1228 /DNA_ORIENTATION=+